MNEKVESINQSINQSISRLDLEPNFNRSNGGLERFSRSG